MRRTHHTLDRLLCAPSGAAALCLVACFLVFVLGVVGCEQSPKPAPPLSDAVERGVCHFEHMQNGARKLRGGSFPADVLLHPYYPSGIKRAPEKVRGLRFGTVRMPKEAVDPRADVSTPGEVVPCVFALGAPREGSSSTRFWLDIDGDGDLTNDVITPDAEPQAFARSNKDVASLLDGFATGTMRVGEESRRYVWAQHRGTGAHYLFLARSGDAFDWQTAWAMHVELAPHVEDDRLLHRGSLGGVIRVGPREAPRAHMIILTPPTGDEEELLLRVDQNADGRLDERLITLACVERRLDVVPVRWAGICTLFARVPSVQGELIQLLDLSLDVRLVRSELDGSLDYSLTYRGEWGRRGSVDLGAGPMDALLFDEMASGDYRGSQGGNDSGVRLLIDLDKDGKFSRGEAFDPSKPFKALDASWMVRELDASGASFRIERLGDAGDAGKATPQPR